MSILSTSQLPLRAAHIRLPFRDSFSSSAQGRPQLRGGIPSPARHSSSLAIAAYSNEMFRALATHLTNNDVDEVVPAATSTLPGFVSSKALVPSEAAVVPSNRSPARTSQPSPRGGSTVEQR